MVATEPSKWTDDAWRLRLAELTDVDALEALIPASVRALQSAFYSPIQLDAALGSVFGVDRLLIRDRTYFVIERNGEILGCGGWSRRRSLFGGDAGRAGEDALLNPKSDAARIRAFFVHPAWARRGIGRAILVACEKAIEIAEFRNVDIVATLAGEPLYAAFGYGVTQRFDIQMSGGVTLPVVRMTKSIQKPTESSKL